MEPLIEPIAKPFIKPEVTLFSIIMLLGAAHGLFLALALVNAKGGSRVGHFLLALLTLAFAIDLGHEFLYQSRYLLNVLTLAYIDPVINLLYGPSFYLYVRALTDAGTFKLEGARWLHFLPVGIGIGVCCAVSLFQPASLVDDVGYSSYRKDSSGARPSGGHASYTGSSNPKSS